MIDPNLQNKNRWNELAPLHFDSEYYKTKNFIADKNFSTLSAIEKEELKTVNLSGKSLLHLQCHIGTDTLSLARLGAQVTGVDYSENSIALANELAGKSGTSGRFIVSDIYDLSDKIKEKFDIVYSNWGSICWLNNIPKWAETISHFLKPNGLFLMAEIHPVGLAHTRKDRVPDWQYTSFEDNRPVKFENNKSYANSNTKVDNSAIYQWPYTLSDIINNVIQSGMKITSLKEYSEAAYKQTPTMVQLGNGLFVEAENPGKVPLSLTLKALKL